MERKKSRIFPWLICGLGALFYCYEYILRISPSVMAQQLAHAFNVDAALLGNAVAFYYYAYTPMQLPVGVLMDRYGPRRLLALAALVCAGGAYLFAYGHLGVAEVGRFFVGFGSAFAFVGVLKLASLWLPPSRFAMIAGMVTSLGMIGAMFGDQLLGHLVQQIGWRTTVYFSAMVGVVLSAVIWLGIPHKKTSEVTGVSITPLDFHQLLKEFIQLIKKPAIWIVGLVGFCLYLPTSAFAEFWGVPYLQRAYGLSDIRADYVISMIFLGWAVGGPIVGWISDRFAKRTVPIILGALLAAFVISIILYMPRLASGELLLLFFLVGMFSSVENIVFAIARENNHPSLVGTAMAVTNMLIMLGGVVFQPLVGVLLDVISGTTAKGNMNVYTGHDFQYALVVLPIGLILAAALISFVREVKPVTEKKTKKYAGAQAVLLED